MENPTNIFSPESRNIIAQFPQYQNGDWLRECALRKRDLDRVEYLSWLKKAQDESFQGFAQSNDGSPANVYHDFRLQFIRQEIEEAEANPNGSTGQHMIRKDVMRLIMEGRLEHALRLTYNYLEQQAELESYQFELIHLLSEFNHYEEKERKGVLNHEQLSTARNRIRNALLGIIKEIREAEL